MTCYSCRNCSDCDNFDIFNTTVNLESVHNGNKNDYNYLMRFYEIVYKFQLNPDILTEKQKEFIHKMVTFSFNYKYLCICKRITDEYFHLNWQLQNVFIGFEENISKNQTKFYKGSITYDEFIREKDYLYNNFCFQHPNLNYLIIYQLYKILDEYKNNLMTALGIDLSIPIHNSLDITNCDSDPDYECPICFNKIEIGDCEKLPCKHMYHKKCITQWGLTHRTCPLCREHFFGSKRHRQRRHKRSRLSRRRCNRNK